MPDRTSTRENTRSDLIVTKLPRGYVIKTKIPNQTLSQLITVRLNFTSIKCPLGPFGRHFPVKGERNPFSRDPHSNEDSNTAAPTLPKSHED